jgi:hypothetical protein
LFIKINYFWSWVKLIGIWLTVWGLGAWLAIAAYAIVVILLIGTDVYEDDDVDVEVAAESVPFDELDDKDMEVFELEFI